MSSPWFIVLAKVEVMSGLSKLILYNISIVEISHVISEMPRNVLVFVTNICCFLMLYYSSRNWFSVRFTQTTNITEALNRNIMNYLFFEMSERELVEETKLSVFFYFDNVPLIYFICDISFFISDFDTFWSRFFLFW